MMSDQDQQTDDYRLKTNSDEIERHLEILFEPDDWIELRSFQGEQRASHCFYTTRSRLESLDKEPFQEWIAEHNNDMWKGIYIGVNPRKTRFGSGVRGMATDGDIAAYRAVFIDWDDANISEASERLEKSNLPAPTMILSSGRLSGTHCYWVFEESIEDEAIWVGLQKALIDRLLSDRSIHNPSRIMRLAGTFNYVRGNDCKIVAVGEKYKAWDDLGIEPKEILKPTHLPDDSIKPERRNLNVTTQKFLEQPCAEGERNLTLFAAAMDYNGNNFPIEQAIRELADERAIVRDGLPRGEAYRTIRNAYARPAAPTHIEQKQIIVGADDSRFTESAVFLSINRGIMRESWDVEADLEWFRNPTPVDLDPKADSKTKDVECSPLLLPKSDSVGDEEDLPLDVNDIAPWQREYGLVHDAYISNCKYKQHGKRTITIAYRASTIVQSVFESLGKWPRWSDATGPFFLRPSGEGRQPRVITPKNASELFGLLNLFGTVNWPSRSSLTMSEEGHRATLIPKGELYEAIRSGPIDNDHHYKTIATLPQYPPNEDTFYVPFPTPVSTGRHLTTLLSAFNPQSDHDRHLLLAMLMTPGWGGAPGARPLFILTSDHGQGSGKTETAKAIGEVWGGAVMLNHELPWDQITKSIMSSEDYLSRVFLYDNVRGKFKGSNIEAAITSKRISGHRMYHGTVSRPNDAMFVVTYNNPELSRDLAQRSVVVKLGKPSRRNFVGWINRYLRKYRREIIADLMELLQRDPDSVIEDRYKTRWQEWQEGVLCKIPGANPNDLSSLIIERQGDSDSDESDAGEIVFALGSYLHGLGRYAHGATRPRAHADLITVDEIHNVLVGKGIWVDPTGVSQMRSKQQCIRWVKNAALGHGVLRPLLTPSGAQRRTYVDETGAPMSGRGPRSNLFQFDSRAASSAFGPLEEDASLFGGPE